MEFVLGEWFGDWDADRGGGLPASARYRKWSGLLLSVGFGVLRARFVGVAECAPCPRIGAGFCERGAGSRGAKRPRGGAGGTLDAAARERMIGRPGQGSWFGGGGLGMLGQVVAFLSRGGAGGRP